MGRVDRVQTRAGWGGCPSDHLPHQGGGGVRGRPNFRDLCALREQNPAEPPLQSSRGSHPNNCAWRLGPPMKTAQVAPLYEAVPPRLYGGTERVVAHLTDALVDLGHQVTLFSSADARTRAELAPVRSQAIRLDPAPLKSDVAAHLSMLSEVRRLQ